MSDAFTPALAPRLRAVPAVTRAVAILRLLGRSRAPMGVKAIAQALGLVPSTALHILRALVSEELVKVDSGTKRYSLGVGMLALARVVLESSDFTGLVQPHLDRLSRRYGVTAIGLEVLGLRHMVVLALSRAQAPVRLHVDVGSRFPALISATGRCVAAFGAHQRGDVEKGFRALRWQTAPSWQTWCREVETARRHGYSIDRGNYINGVTVVAVPLLDARRPLSHCLAAVGLSSQLDRATCVSVAHDMQAAASAVTAHVLGKV
jgi:DNA-binding IclR family transcriptional regulator